MPNPHDYSDTLPGDRIVCVGSADHTFFYVPSSYVKSHCLTFRDVVEDSIKNGHTLRFDCRARVLRVIFDAMTKNTVNVESAQELLTDIIQVCEEYEMPNIALTIVSEIVSKSQLKPAKLLSLTEGLDKQLDTPRRLLAWQAYAEVVTAAPLHVGVESLRVKLATEAEKRADDFAKLEAILDEHRVVECPDHSCVEEAFEQIMKDVAKGGNSSASMHSVWKRSFQSARPPCEDCPNCQKLLEANKLILEAQYQAYYGEMA